MHSNQCYFEYNNLVHTVKHNNMLADCRRERANAAVQFPNDLKGRSIHFAIKEKKKKVSLTTRRITEFITSNIT